MYLEQNIKRGDKQKANKANHKRAIASIVTKGLIEHIQISHNIKSTDLALRSLVICKNRF